MPRKVFFSFHYQRDIFRVNQVKNHYLTKDSYTEAGYFDGSLEEKAKREGDTVVKNLIDRGLQGCSVLCVLIGSETYTRRWVHYEIFKGIEVGMGVLGIRIHQLACPRTGTDTKGANPFDFLGYGSNGNEQIQPMIKYTQGWKNAPLLSPISRASATYLRTTDKPILSSLFNVYDWKDGNGYNNFGNWIEAAANRAGR
jgi:MTH538 TIR-like domain (DUF1863)